MVEAGGRRPGRPLLVLAGGRFVEEVLVLAPHHEDGRGGYLGPSGGGLVLRRMWLAGFAAGSADPFCRLVLAASRDDIVAGENRAVFGWQAMAAFTPLPC